jgi:hypothetical protein
MSDLAMHNLGTPRFRERSRAGLLIMPSRPDWRERWLLLVVVLAVLAMGVYFHRTENRPPK